MDDVIIVSGHNLGTAEVESAFVAHSKVAEAAVVGCPHDIKGNVVLAENKARKLFEDLTKARLKEKDKKINVPSWQTKFFSFSLILWLTGVLWLLLDFMNLGSYGKTTLTIFHGALIIPALVSLGVLIVSHIPEGWEPTEKRKSGFLLSFIMFFLVISGFVLFYTDYVIYELSYSHSSIGIFFSSFFDVFLVIFTDS